MNQEFEKIFGNVDKSKEYLCLKQGILDFNLGNLIINSKGKVYFFDYEWCFNFPIPKDFILFRALFVLLINTSLKKFYTLDELLKRYLEFGKYTKRYYRWEEFFIKEVVSKNKVYQTYTLPNIQVDILEMNKEREEQERLNKKIKEVIDEKEALNKEVEEFQAFKKDLIWKTLEKYRELKRKVKRN